MHLSSCVTCTWQDVPRADTPPPTKMISKLLWLLNGAGEHTKRFLSPPTNYWGLFPTEDPPRQSYIVLSCVACGLRFLAIFAIFVHIFIFLKYFHIFLGESREFQLGSVGSWHGGYGWAVEIWGLEQLFVTRLDLQFSQDMKKSDEPNLNFTCAPHISLCSCKLSTIFSHSAVHDIYSQYRTANILCYFLSS